MSVGPTSAAPWLAEVGRTLLVRTYPPPDHFTARVREEVMLAVAEANGERWCAFVHGAWRDLLGDVDGDVAEEAILDYGRACAEAGRPLDVSSFPSPSSSPAGQPSTLADLLPPAALAAVRATVARAEVECLVGARTDDLLRRLTGRRVPLAPATLLDAVTALAASPVALPALGVAAAMRAVTRVAPPPPEVRLPTEPNLLAHLLDQAVRAWLANAVVRVVALSLPITISLGFRAGRSAATVRLGRQRVEILNGVAADAWVVLEGDVEPLLRLASGSILRELTRVRLRPG
ncbi:MAG: hypothetical protein ACRD0U_21685 [Acidimicrobiales bacterium]